MWEEDDVTCGEHVSDEEYAADRRSTATQQS